jgi:hypothetical protein
MPMTRASTRVKEVPGGWVHFVSDGEWGMHVYLLSSFPAKYQRAFIWMPRVYFCILQTRRVVLIYAFVI